MNGKSTTVSGSDDNFSVGAMPCPKSGEIRVRLAHESTIDLPIPGVKVKLYEDKNWARDKEVKKGTTDENGEVVFSDLEPGKLYYPVVIDNNLVENNKAMMRAYDEHMLALYQSMSTRWAEYKPQWQQSRLGAAILESFGKGLEDGLCSIWSDAKTAYNVITNPKKYATEIYEGASALYAQVGQLDSADIEAILTSSKQLARELFALFNDEAMLYLLARSVILNLRMYPWGELLVKVAGIGGSVIGETLVGVVFGALMSLIAGPLGIAYLAYRLSRAFGKALHLVQEVWAVLTKIMKSSIELLMKAFEKTRNVNHRRQINAPLSKNKKVELGSGHST
ncbi:prealbumin-like fold domain-containing protein, partial [Escherichia coli]|uniref:prealbumin-like fold domain-containing protein n=1 Tax=Escherichia coli TaxID=562 RepID=UPI00148511B1